MTRFRRAWRAFEAPIPGQALGAISLFVLLVAGLWVWSRAG